MTDKPSVLAVIAARGGSKGLPRKNVLDLGGRPLVAWSVAAASAAREISQFLLSSDDDEIIKAAQEAGCQVPFKRPAELASDTASIYDVLLHAHDHSGSTFDYVVLLQATSPLRTSQDIDSCIRLCLDSKAPAALTMVKAAKPPQWMYRLDAQQRPVPLLDASQAIGRRQEAVDCFVPNGAVYVARTEWLRENKSFMGPDTRVYIMPPERSIDIDAYLDLVTARAVLTEMKKGAFR